MPESHPKPEVQPLRELPFPLRLHGAIALPINADSYAVAPPEKLARAMIDTLSRSIET